MASVIVIRNGKAEAVYDDRFRPVLEALGVMEVERATDVEFDGATGDWIATLRATGQEIARGHNRDDVIRREVEYLERQLQTGGTSVTFR